MIDFENVSKSYYGEIKVEVLHDLNFSIPQGLVLILGSSGCGKTTLLNLIGGIDAPSNGKIVFEGVEVPFHSHRELVSYRRNKIGMIFQFYNLLPTLTALENLEIVLDLTTLNKKEKKDRCLFYLDRVGLKEKAHRFPYQLSGGEQQRIAIARALVKKPSVVLADEPTGNLDEANHEIIMNLINEMAHEEKTTYIVATHNEKVVYLADHVFNIQNGRVINH